MIQEKQIKIKGMHCKSCADSIEEKLKTVNGIKEVRVSFINEQAFVGFNPEKLNLESIMEKIKEMGYGASVEDNTFPNLQKEKVIRISMRSNKIIILVLCLILLIAAVFTKGFGIVGSNTDKFISISLSEITNRVKWYEYESEGKKIKFFAVKADDGTIKTAFDACDICYPEKKGYRQEGNYMVCNNCGNRYPIRGLGTENRNPGGCWPGYLPSAVQEDNVIIKKSDLENNRWNSL